MGTQKEEQFGGERMLRPMWDMEVDVQITPGPLRVQNPNGRLPGHSPPGGEGSRNGLSHNTCPPQYALPHRPCWSCLSFLLRTTTTRDTAGPGLTAQVSGCPSWVCTSKTWCPFMRHSPTGCLTDACTYPNSTASTCDCRSWRPSRGSNPHAAPARTCCTCSR